MTLGQHDSTINVVMAIIIIIIIIIIIFDPGTQFPRKEKITLCNIKKYKNQSWNEPYSLLLLLLLLLTMVLCPCLSQVGVLSKRLNESSWFLACKLPSARPTLC